MQTLLLAGSIPATICGSASASFLFSKLFAAATRSCSRRQWSPVVAASSSAAAINGEQNHYYVLGLTQTASAADIKKAYRLLARKYHPDVCKEPRAPELFKSIHHAYEVLSNEATRIEYDQALHSSRRPYREKRSYGTEFEEEIRMYRWAKVRQKMHRERYQEYYSVNFSDTDEENEESSLNGKRGSFGEVLRFAFLSLLLFQTLGAQLSLTFSSLMALFDRKLDTGYKIGYAIAWFLGGRSGILLTLCLSFTSWVCGKTSSSVVALVLVAMWVSTYLARYAPLPQGAVLTLLYMSIKLQSE